MISKKQAEEIRKKALEEIETKEFKELERKTDATINFFIKGSFMYEGMKMPIALGNIAYELAMALAKKYEEGKWRTEIVTQTESDYSPCLFLLLT